MATVQHLSMEIARLIGRPESEGWAFWRTARDHHMIPLGTAGRGGIGRAVAGTPQAVLLLLAMVWGGGIQDSLSRAAKICALPFLSCGRSIGNQLEALSTVGAFGAVQQPSQQPQNSVPMVAAARGSRPATYYAMSALPAHAAMPNLLAGNTAPTLLGGR